ncbi:hypothetical protein BDN72DRAFT_868228 [Pluteus cervinus]|uniref:Uncharacterized protein n=1 Tax=Pluteus cervinus TaxID=181527 RepID=A0ACD3BBA0_9AGAR|nr:hypothetical protein BDN72DRAFT_868228 [Pluteus cervinus]
MNDVPTNAIAGPSSPRRIPIAGSTPSELPPTPGLFFPPPAQPQPQTYLASTQDLLSRFNLVPAYDKYVRPFAATNESGIDQPLPATPNPTVTSGIDKGKAREVVGISGGQTGGGPMAGDRGDADDDDGPGGKAGKKKKNSYKHLIKNMPGKHSMKKDDYLATMIQIPPKQRVRIASFDPRTQRDAFNVSLEGLKGWNSGNLIAESPQARESRKKQREAKRLHTLPPQETLVPQPPLNGAPSQVPIQAPIPTPASAPSTTERPPATSTPQPNPVGTTKPGSSAPRPGSTVPRPGSVVARPGSIAPGSTPTNAVRSASGPIKPSGAQPSPQLPTSVSSPVVANTNGPTNPLNGPRGVKRERDETGAVANGTGVNGTAAIMNGAANGTVVAMQGTANAAAPKAIVNARAGIPGVRPRPVKKQRLEVQGPGRDVTAPVQQPTPQGV